MQKDELLKLAERVEALSGPDMEIFYKVRDALWPYDPATPIEDQLPALLARQQFDRFVHGGAWLDASMTLVPDAYVVCSISETPEIVKEEHTGDIPLPNWEVTLLRQDCAGYRNRKKFMQAFKHGDGNTAPNALCAAALRALAGGE